jgi:hypothetical protein
VDTTDVTVRVYDRLHAPNTHETRQALGEAIVAAVGEVVGTAASQIEALSDDPREPLSLRVRTPRVP